MTNRSMVKADAARAEPPERTEAREAWARRGPTQPMPATESDAAAITHREPLDSPQPKPQLSPGRAGGLTTEKDETRRE